MSWFEEPVSSEDLDGLRLLRDRAPAGMEIAAGEYGYEPAYFRRMLAAGAVDVQQADATRCGGITGLLGRRRALPGPPASRSRRIARRSCTRTPCCAIGPLRHLEYFHDHARIEQMLFDGALSPARRRAAARPRPSRAWASSSGPRDAEALRRMRSRRPDHASPRRACVRNLRRGRAQRLLSGATAAAALPLGRRDLRQPLRRLVRQQVDVDAGRALARRWAPPGSPASRPSARRGPWLPALSALYIANGALGVYLHLRGIARKPGGLREASYNLVMGPPLLAPGSLTMVGAIGLAAAVMRRER